MDELELGGRRHISAKRAAKEHRYHSDYIGQLIRSGKVVGQKVGRSWYVDAESLDAYLKGEALPTSAAVAQPAPVAPVVAVPVAPQPVEPVVAPVVAPVVVHEEVRAEAQPTEVVVAEQPVAIAQEEEPVHHIEITKPQPIVAPAPVVVAPPAPSGLRFVPDDEPIAPVRTMSRDIPVPVTQQAETEVEEEEVIIRPTPAPQSRGSLVGMVAAGVCVFALALASSYIMVHRTVVAGEESQATVFVSLEK